jgi:hypothetical protein
VGHWSDQPDGFLVTALAGLSTQKVEVIAVPALLGVIAAADDMHCQPAPQQMLKGGEFAGPINPTAFW